MISPTPQDNRLLHLGYMKTASTFLQHSIFSEAPFGFGLPGHKSRRFLVREIILSDGFRFDAEAVAKRFAEREQPVRDQGLMPVWSEETLLGEPLSRRYDAYSNINRLHSIMPDARVLITIREQCALAGSMYVEYIRQGGTASLTSFIGTGEEHSSFMPFMHPHFLEFDRAIGYTQKLFGRDQVLVLPQELLVQDAQAYFRKLNDFTGGQVVPRHEGRVHASIGAATSALQKLGNHLIAPDPLQVNGSRAKHILDKGMRGIDKIVPAALNARSKRKRMTQILNRYDGTFAQSNQALSEMIGIDLGALGYAV